MNTEPGLTRTKKRGPADSNAQQVQLFQYPFDVDHPIVYQEVFYPKTTEPNYDIHQGLELGIVLTGLQRRLYEKYDFIAEPGQIWFAGLWEPHGCEVLNPKTRVLVMEIVPDFFAGHEPYSRLNWFEIFQLSPQVRPQANSLEDRRFVLNIARKMMQTMKKESPFKLDWLNFAIRELLLYFYEELSRTPAGQDHYRENTWLHHLSPALALIEETRGRKITLAEAARASNMSRSLFIRLFQQIMGMSFGKYCLRMRMAGVINDLRNTDKKLESMAVDWGFTNASHLIRTFKTLFKQTPYDYRRTWQKQPTPVSPILVRLSAPQ
jgi:AraC-like DNA-binding protein